MVLFSASMHQLLCETSFTSCLEATHASRICYIHHHPAQSAAHSLVSRPLFTIQLAHLQKPEFEEQNPSTHTNGPNALSALCLAVAKFDFPEPPPKP